MSLLRSKLSRRGIELTVKHNVCLKLEDNSFHHGAFLHAWVSMSSRDEKVYIAAHDLVLASLPEKCNKALGMVYWLLSFAVY